ncbi:unnamed protein product [Parascedosporium putredinis]|uniref:Uncharacterized protein n=1 Tax=Parascedosporium putredinis TaxID=1442378 RepID=A0A9P1M740_9PEZI|nr:unnamed protein product [Parascedosporium putredinis]CAI7990868.1 unnamed protein product [Parascedosporium putredinis]
MKLYIRNTSEIGTENARDSWGRSASAVTDDFRVSSLAAGVDLDLLIASTTMENQLNRDTQTSSDIIPSAELYDLDDECYDRVNGLITLDIASVGDPDPRTSFSWAITPELNAEVGGRSQEDRLQGITDAAEAITVPELRALSDSVYNELGSYVCKTTGDTFAYIYSLQSQSQALATLRKSIRDLKSREDRNYGEEIACLKRDVLATVLLQLTVEMANGGRQMPGHIDFAMQLFDDLGYVRVRPALSVETEIRALANRYFNGEERPRERKYLTLLAKCFYWSTVILLQRRVFRDAPSSNRVQAALAMLLKLMDDLPLGCGPDSSLSLPLYVAARESVDAEHRERVREKSRQLISHYPSKTREAMLVAFETWWHDMDVADDWIELTIRPRSAVDQVKDGTLLMI